MALTVNMLWGKLRKIPNPRNEDLIDLSKKSVGFTLETPIDYPRISFFPGKRKGKKVLLIEYEEGRVDIIDQKGNFRDNKYIENDTSRLRLYKFRENDKYLEYEYNFLNKLFESYDNPVWVKKEFVGRTAILSEIKKNFSKAKGDYYNYIITGMGNVGKTSLLKYLYKITFNEENELKCRFLTGFIDCKVDFRHSFSHFKKYFREKIKNLIENKRLDKLILIDDYDLIYEKYPVDFINLLDRYFKQRNTFFVLAGKRAPTFFGTSTRSLLQRYTHTRLLRGLDGLSNAIPKGYALDSLESNQLISRALGQIGFPQYLLTNKVRRQVITLASGNPYIIKRIIYVLISEWQEKYTKDFAEKHVDMTIPRIVDACKDYIIRRACHFDRPRDDVSFAEIFNHLSILGKGKGVGVIQEVKEAVCDDSKPRIKASRIASFNKKLGVLQELGLIDIKGSVMIGIPYMFYYEGREKIV